MKRSLIFRTAPRKRSRKPIKVRGRPRFKGREWPEYRAWIREQVCELKPASGLVGDLGSCLGPIQAPHVLTRSTGAFDAADLIPLCERHHETQHLRGLWSLTLDNRVNLAERAIRLFQRFLEEQGT